MSEELLSLAEAAEALNVSEITIKRYIYAGKLRSHKLPGGQHRIPRSELARLLEGGATPPAPEEVMTGLESRVDELESALEHVTAGLQVLAAWCAKRQQDLPEAATEGPASREVAILGPGCNKCRKLHATVLEVVGESFPEVFTVTHITDLDRITSYGPILTPALVVDGRIVSAGRVLLRDEVQRLLTKALE
jgi:excisionase family DNA binding protein